MLSEVGERAARVGGLVVREALQMGRLVAMQAGAPAGVASLGVVALEVVALRAVVTVVGVMVEVV